MSWLKKILNIDSKKVDSEEVMDPFNISQEQKREYAAYMDATQELNEMRTVIKEEREQKEQAQADQLVVVHGAKIKMGAHMGEFKVLNDVPTTQGKPTGTIAEKTIANFTFYDGFQLMSVLGDWQNSGTYKVQNNEVLIKKSTLQAMGKMPGNTPPETAPIEIIHPGQINIPGQIITKGAPVPYISETPSKTLMDYIVYFEHSVDYDGEYGFDWYRDDNLEQGCEEAYRNNFEKENFLVRSNEKPEGSNIDYFIPWLIMFPKHKNIIGKEVKLLIKVDPESIIDGIDYDEEKISLKGENGLEISPNEISFYDAIGTAGVEITVFCKEALTVDSKIYAESSRGKKVGVLNVMKNADYKKYKLNIHVVNAYLTDDDRFKKSVIEESIKGIGGLKAIEKYLNTKSLNQALIQVEFILEDNQPIDWGFSKRSLLTANQGKNTRTGENDLYYIGFKELIKNEETFEVDSEKTVNYFNHQMTLMGKAQSKNIIIYLTSLQSDNAGGTAFLVPLNARHCIIYNSNLKSFTSYAHELAHTLGLPHIFVDENYADSIEENRNTINEDRRYLRSYSLDAYTKEYVEKRIIKYQEILNGYLRLKEYDKIKFHVSTTENFMDYRENRKSFMYWQIKIMQNEVVSYYSS